MADHLPAVHTGPRPDIKHIIRLADRFFVVFNDDNRIALIPQVFQRLEQAVIIALVQADGRFIEHVKHPCQPRPDLRRKPNTLAFPPAERPARACQRQIFQPDIVQESQTFANFLEDRARDFVLLNGQIIGHFGAPVKSFADRHFNDLSGMQQRVAVAIRRADLDSKRFGPQAVAVAGATGAVVLVAFEFFADPVAIRLAVAALHIGDHPFEHAADLVHTAAFVIAELDLFLAGAMQENLLHLLGQIFPPRIFTKLIVFCDGFNRLLEIRGLTFAPRGQRTVIDLEVLVGHHKAFIKKQLFAQTITGRTGTERSVE